MTQIVMDIFYCQTYHVQTRLRVDLDIICWGDTHMWAIGFIAIPCLVIHVIGIPALVAFDLHRKFKESRVSESEEDYSCLLSRFGFLVAGYSQDVYWW